MCSTKQISQNIILLGDCKCGNCEFTKNDNFFNHPDNKSPVFIKSFITCKKDYVIYITQGTCNKCMLVKHPVH